MSSISEALAGLPGQFVVRESSIQAAPASPPVQLLAPNALRWAFIMSVSTQGFHTGKVQYVSTVQTNPALGIGLPVLTDDTVIDYDFRRWGAFVQQAFWTVEFGIGVTVTWTVIEVLIQQ